MIRTGMLALAVLAVLMCGAPVLAQGGGVKAALTQEWMEAMDAMDTAREKGHFAEAERHLTTALQKARAIGAESEPLQMTHMSALLLFSETKAYPKAETHGKSALAIVEARTGKSSEDTASLLGMLAQFYLDAEMEDKAEAPATRALAIFDKRPKDNVGMITGMLMLLAMSEQANDRLLACEPHLTRVRELTKADGAAGQEDYVLMLLHGGVQGILGHVPEAVSLVEKAAAGLHRLKDVDAELLNAADLTVCAMTAMQGKVAESDRQARAVFARLAAKPTKDTVRVLDMVRGYQHELGNVAEEERLLVQMRAMATKVYGKEPVPLETQADMAEAEADLLWNRGAYAEAEQGMRQAIALELQRYPTGYGIANRKMNQALWLTEMERYDDAVAILRECKPLIEAGYGAHSLPGVLFLTGVGRIALARGELADAARFLDAAQAEAEKIFGADSGVMLSENWRLTAELRCQQGRAAEGKALAEKAAKAVAAEIGTTVPAYAESLLALADCNRDLATAESLKQADAQYVQVLTIQIDKLPATHPKLATTCEHYAKYLHAVKRDKDAAGFETKAKGIRAPKG